MNYNDLNEIKKAYISTYLYEYSLKQVRKVYEKKINELVNQINYLAIEERDELILKYTKHKQNFINEIEEIFEVIYLFKNDTLFVYIKTSYGNYSYLFNENKKEIIKSNLDNSMILKNTKKIYDIFKLKNEFVDKFNNINIENTDLTLNADTSNKYIFNDEICYNFSELLYLSNKGTKILLNKKINEKDIKFSEEQLSIEIINEINKKNQNKILKKIFKRG